MGWRETALWHSAFVTSAADPHRAARQRLALAYERMRERAGVIANEIANSLPEFTLHDLEHLDALWEMSQLVVEDAFVLTPAEAFVLGGAILTHDLALAAASYPGGQDELKQLPGWNQALYTQLKTHLGRPPTSEELHSAPREVIRLAQSNLLRESHAQQAAKLAQLAWTDSDTNTQFYLIDDSELRVTYASLIGQLAASHWWYVSELPRRFPTTLGAAVGLPSSWTVDPLTVACVLRCADAAQLDARRAPPFLRAIRHPRGASRVHWQFQEHLQQPRRDGDRLVYTSARPFQLHEAHAWWLCYDALSAVDLQLRAVDALLADLGRQRLALRSVAGATDPERLSVFIGTEGWTPIDASVRITDVPDLVQKLGGRELYGDTPLVALRELVQNGADAVRALRAVYGQNLPESDDYRGRIEVRLTKDGPEQWLEVRDDGIGMSLEVLSGALVDFGRSAWAGIDVGLATPELDPTAFEPTGRYGIGFFSVFMLGERVQVISRRFDASVHDTHVVEFLSGLSSRPIVRQANEGERLLRCGTRVRVLLARPERLFAWLSDDDADDALTRTCQGLFPAIDVDIVTRSTDGMGGLAVEADDWLTIPTIDLIRRITTRSSRRYRRRGEQAYIESMADRVVIVKNEQGRPVGRAALVPPMSDGRYSSSVDFASVVTVGGAATSTSVNLSVGVWVGRSIRAARDAAEPIVDLLKLQAWLLDQIGHLQAAGQADTEALTEVAEFALATGTSSQSLPVAETSGGRWLSLVDLVGWAKDFGEILLVQDASLWLERRENGELQLLDNVLSLSVGRRPVLGVSNSAGDYWPVLPSRFGTSGFYTEHTVAGAVMVAVADSWNCEAVRLLRQLNQGRDEEEQTIIGHRDGRPVWDQGVRRVVKPAME